MVFKLLLILVFFIVNKTLFISKNVAANLTAEQAEAQFFQTPQIKLQQIEFSTSYFCWFLKTKT